MDFDVSKLDIVTFTHATHYEGGRKVHFRYDGKRMCNVSYDKLYQSNQYDTNLMRSIGVTFRVWLSADGGNLCQNCKKAMIKKLDNER